MTGRSGERLGWLGGWTGGFLWVLILAIVWLVRGKATEGIVGLGLTGLALGVIFATAPWKRPTVPYWKLMVPLYVVLALTILWAVWSFGGMHHAGFSLWSLWPFVMVLVPLGTTGRRCWIDGDVPPPAAPTTSSTPSSARDVD
jgi:hypothetical protein